MPFISPNIDLRFLKFRRFSSLVVFYVGFSLVPSNAIAVDVDPSTLIWQSCGSCPSSPLISASGPHISVGSTSSSENDSQNRAYHIVSAQLPPASGYSITFSYILRTWDSYNSPGTPNPPFNGGTGYWDSFSVSVTSSPIWSIGPTDPLTTSQIPGLGFLWGGSSFGDMASESRSGQKTIVIQGNPNGTNFLNVGLDTSSLPHADTAFPSGGTFTITKIETNGCGAISMNVPLSKQCNSGWSSDNYDHVSGTMCQLGCATSSVAMLLSYYGVSTTPKQYNDWLKNHYHDANGNGEWDSGEATYGYTSSGAIIWDAVAAYSGNKVTYKGSGNGTQSALDTELCASRPSILRVPGHFIVATGKPSSGSLGTYTINDPGYQKSTLAQWSSSFSSMRRFGAPGSGSIVVYASSNVELLLTDPLGRSVGWQGGTIVNEIIGASYEVETIDNTESGAMAIATTVLHVPDPTQGFYSLSVSSTLVDEATIEIYRFTFDERPQTKISTTVTLDPNSAVQYEFPYSTRTGDVNGDGFVNEQDVQMIIDSIGSSHGDPRFNPVADMDQNGAVAIEDYQVVVNEIPNADFDADGVLDNEDSCLNSNTVEAVVIDSCDSGVVNTIDATGCSLSDYLAKCELEIRNHGNFVSCAAKTFNSWRTQGLISNMEKELLQSCAAQSDLGKK